MRRLAFAVILCGLSSPTLFAQAVVREILPVGPRQPPVGVSASAWGAVRLVPGLLSWIGDVGLRSRLREEIAQLSSEALNRAPAGGGTIVVIGLSESEAEDVNGNRVTLFLDAYVADSGSTLEKALQTLHGRDRLERGGPEGFVRRNSYFWVSR